MDVDASVLVDDTLREVSPDHHDWCNPEADPAASQHARVSLACKGEEMPGARMPVAQRVVVGAIHGGQAVPIDSDRAREALRIQEEDARWTDDDVVYVAAFRRQVVEDDPAFTLEWSQCLWRWPLRRMLRIASSLSTLAG